MSILMLGILVFVGSYGLSILYISVFYHRALAHGAVTMHPRLRTWVRATGSWVTGIDPKAWICMHRLHHKFSDTKKDPHSPLTAGIWNVFPLQLFSYKRTLRGLIAGDPKYASIVSDLDFPVNGLNRKRRWYLPYLFHAVLALAIGFLFQTWFLPACYWIGMMSHPIQGWMVNALSHRYGYRNFNTDDNSKNNMIVAWLVLGEGYQNNHHNNPRSPNFSNHWWEIDPGYLMVLVLMKLGLLRVQPQRAFYLLPEQS